MMQKEVLEESLKRALNKIGVNDGYELIFEIPKNPAHGDLSVNIAMQLAKRLGKAPRQIADDIIQNLEANQFIEKIEIAGPGFINFKFSNAFYTSALKELMNYGENFGKNDKGAGVKVNVEYVSANPTGLLHMGHGRNAAIGDTIANLFEWNGYNVTREYYFNNAGNQMRNLTLSIYARYIQANVDAEYPFPEDGYHGEYVKEIAAELFEKYGESLKEKSEENLKLIKEYGENWCFTKIKETLTRMNIDQEVYYNEDSLYKDGKIDRVIDDLKKLGLAYEKDGAWWLKLSEMGMEDDRVIVKSTGEPTYRLPDIAYHREKFLRGFDLLVDVFGADHIATVPDVMAGVKALGFDPEKVKVLIHQFVTLTENGVQVKMSKRTGKSYTLDDLLDEVGGDVVRFFFIMRGISTHLEFDLSLAREQSDKNPVFYLQYAHARIAGINEKAKEAGLLFDSSCNTDSLTNEHEINLIKILLRFVETVANACQKYEPQILAEYLRELAQNFHVFYHNCRILGEEEQIAKARLALAITTKIAMKNGLKILGITAPERM